MNKIPYGRHNITEEDIKAVINVLKSDNLTQGPQVPLFERAFAEYIGVKYAVAVSNGTAALHLCTMALGVKKGDKVITTPITFAASANCVRYSGGEVIFADINPKTHLLEIEETRKLLESDHEHVVKGIIPVDFAGRAVDMEAFRRLADDFGCWLIEDACHAPGGYFKDSNNVLQHCGNGNFADLAVFSFHPVKHIACGEGGMITTNNEEIFNTLRNLRTHGIQQNPDLRIYSHEFWYYEMQDLGYNYRLTDFQAALGNSQLLRADEGLIRRKEISSFYQDFFSNKSYVIQQTGTVEGHAYHLYILEIDNRKGLYEYLRKYNIYAQIHYIPVHLMPYYRKLGWKENDLPFAEKYYKQCLSIPIFPTLTLMEQEYVCKIINDFYQ
jgi:UDP-4-amino-4,6-dideoxy-N-acetyl-beta-L-altrosamine transaminase